jgi:hypothetical protein
LQRDLSASFSLAQKRSEDLGFSPPVACLEPSQLKNMLPIVTDQAFKINRNVLQKHRFSTENIYHKRPFTAEFRAFQVINLLIKYCLPR